MVYDLIPIYQPYTVIYSNSLIWSSNLQLLSHYNDYYTFIPVTCGIHHITYGSNILTLEAIPDDQIISITLLLLYTNRITGYRYKDKTYTTNGTPAYDLTYDQTIPIKIKKTSYKNPIEFYLCNGFIIYDNTPPTYGYTSLGNIILNKFDL